MAVSDQLHSLIHSMTRNEKRYFKVYANNGENRELAYVEIFDIIMNQKEYDEQKLLKLLRNKQTAKNISVYKNYLYELILRSLAEFHQNKSADFKINSFIQYVRILQAKGQYKQAAKYLKKAENLALKHEKITRILEIKEVEKYMVMDMRLGSLQEGMSRIMSEEQDWVSILLNKSIYMDAYYKSQLLYKQERYVRSADKIEKLESILNSPMFKSIDKARSTYARNVFYDLHAQHQWNISQTKKALEIKQEQLKIWLDNVEMQEDEYKAYISFLSDYLYISYHAGEFGELEKFIEVLKNTETSDPEMQVKIFVETSVFSLIYHQHWGDYDTCMTLLKEVKKELPDYEEKLNSEQATRIFISSSIIAFGGGDNSQALFWINRILNRNDTLLREDIHCFARIFNLFIHFELDDGRALEYIIQSTYRFLSKRKKLFKLEKAVIRFLKKLLHAQDQEDMNILFSKLLVEFEKISEDPLEKKFFKVFDFITWLKAKLAGKSYRELVKEKAAKKIETSS